MKKTVLAFAIITFIGLSAAVVSENGSSKECPPGQMCITGAGSSSSASATTAVGPNGTEYKSEVSMTASTCLEPPARNISNIEYSNEQKAKVTFEGQLQTPNPCYTIDQQTSEIGPDSYRINITTAQAEGSGPCVQCLGAISYNASFETDKPFKLEIVHEGEKVKQLEHPDYEKNGSDTGETPENTSFMSGIMNWFRGLF